MTTPSMLPWEVLQVLQVAYQKILIRDGYLTNLGENVNLEDPTVNEDSLPVLVITGEPIGGHYQGDRFVEWSLEVTVEASIKAGRDDSQHTAWQAHADILAATPKFKPNTLPKGAHSLKITDAKILQPAPGQPFVVVQVVLSIGLVTQ